MKVELTPATGHEDSPTILKEMIEPCGDLYVLHQDENNIILTTFQLRELMRAINMFLTEKGY